jgi:hypothetical protein
MDTPRVLLEHYLKQLRLPTVVREYPKLAEQCAKDDHSSGTIKGPERRESRRAFHVAGRVCKPAWVMS